MFAISAPKSRSASITLCRFNPSVHRISVAASASCRTLFLTPLFVALTTIASSGVMAQDARLGQVVVTASRTAQQIADALPHTTVITREEIEASQASDVLSLMRRQAGVEIAQTGGTGGTASVFMRGTNSNHVLLLIDGLRINAVNSGAPLWPHLMLDEIERIEIVRGNVSALYGSEAVGGVVQIFTRLGRGAPSASVSLQAGGDRARALSVHAGGEFGRAGAKTRASVTASSRSARGFSAIDADLAPSANPDTDGYRNRSASVRVTQQIDAHEIGASVLSSRGWLDFDDPTDYGFFGPVYVGRSETHRERVTLDSATVHARLRLNDQWSSTLQLGQMRDFSDSTSSYPLSFNIATALSRTRQLSWQNTVELAPEHTLTGGVEHLDQVGNNSAYPNAFSRRVNSVMAGYSGNSGKHQGQLNLRHDRYSDFGDASTALAAYGYKFAPNWKATAQVSTAFKAPTFSDLYFPFFGNPALEPERARSIEAGLQYAHDKDFLRVALHRSQIDDLIVFDPAIGIANNVASARITGLELTGKTTWKEFELSGNLSLQRPVNTQTGQRLMRRASRTLNLGVARAVGPWRLGADLQASGPRFDSDINTFARTQLSGYGVVNLTASQVLNKNLTFGLALQNAFDKHYALVHGYKTPGRAALVTLAVKM